MSQTSAVRAKGLFRAFDDFVAVNGIDFDIKVGECFGFLGPNGAGKTTTMRMIYRTSPVGGGTLEIFGRDASTQGADRDLKAMMGVVPQLDNLDQEMSVEENLTVFARFYGMSRADRRAKVEEMIDFADLVEKRHALVETLSGGMKRRLMIARGLLGDPKLVILDEPTTGLDPRARQRIWEKLSELRKRNATLILTTHYMEEAERLCDRIAIMDAGEIVALGSPRQLIAEHVSKHVVDVRLGFDGDRSTLKGLHADAERVEELQDRVLLYVDDAESLIARVAHEFPELDALVRQATLDDVFLKITGRGLDG